MTEHVVELIDVALYGGMMQPIPNKIKEEIVRCRDCKYWDYDSDECTMFNCWLNCDGDGFCAWGEKNLPTKGYKNLKR